MKANIRIMGTPEEIDAGSAEWKESGNRSELVVGEYRLLLYPYPPNWSLTVLHPNIEGNLGEKAEMPREEAKARAVERLREVLQGALDELGAEEDKEEYRWTPDHGGVCPECDGSGEVETDSGHTTYINRCGTCGGKE